MRCDFPYACAGSGREQDQVGDAFPAISRARTGINLVFLSMNSYS